MFGERVSGRATQGHRLGQTCSWAGAPRRGRGEPTRRGYPSPGPRPELRPARPTLCLWAQTRNKRSTPRWGSGRQPGGSAGGSWDRVVWGCPDHVTGWGGENRCIGAQRSQRTPQTGSSGPQEWVSSQLWSHASGSVGLRSRGGSLLPLPAAGGSGESFFELI